ncbi:hypothetical protein C8J57DRAFT_585090 [Mycena rebaudengoi]|nr:hypothetical protein C8J57DRAFT_585090 [Mycena rebaudengoi]
MSRRNRETTVLSSDDDIPLIISSRKVAKRSPPKRKTPATPNPELIEILSSDSEESPPRKRQTTKASEEVEQLQQANRVLQQKCLKLEGDLGHTQKEISDLKLASKRAGKIVLDAVELEDHLSCEICTTMMWTPYILSSCGHAYCLKCLVEWFDTTLAQHMASHPAWRPTNQPPFHRMDPRIRAHPYIALIVQQLGPQPEYSCPTCRAPVHTRPVEDYSLKAIVQAVASNMGETSPVKSPALKRKGKAKAKPVAGPFDRFFGKDI